MELGTDGTEALTATHIWVKDDVVLPSSVDHISILGWKQGVHHVTT